MAKYTKKAMMDTFLELLETKSVDKITVKDIVETCGINRNTFYYYYADIYELMEDVLMTQTEEGVKKIGDCSSFYEEYVNTAALVINYKQAILHLFNSKTRDAFEQYLETIIINFIERFVRKAADGHNLLDEDITYISRFYAYSVTGSMIQWIKDGMKRVHEDVIKDMSDSFDATIDDMIVERESKRKR